MQSKTNTHKPLFYQIKVCFIKSRVSLIYDYRISMLWESVRHLNTYHIINKEACHTIDNVDFDHMSL